MTDKVVDEWLWYLRTVLDLERSSIKHNLPDVVLRHWQDTKTMIEGYLNKYEKRQRVK